jgi:hypothetical protein
MAKRRFGGFSVKKQGFQGLTARNQGLTHKTTKDSRDLGAKRWLRTADGKNREA